MARSSRSKPAEELVELPEDESESEEDADYSNDEPDSGAGEEDADDDAGSGSEDAEDEESKEVPEIDPYKVLDVPKDASASQIKKTYHKLALKNHPDKVTPEQRESADAKFKEIVFAYSILSDEKKRKLYDSTGRTDGEGSDFDWKDFMANQYKVVINADIINNVKKEYVGSEEEKADVLKAYKKGKGNWNTLFEEVMLSVMLDPKDETRFRKYIDEAISSGTVKSYPAYSESTQDRAKRLKRAEKEAKEAEKILKKMGVKSDPAKMSEDELGQLIRSRRPDTFAALDADSSEALARHYESKYGTPKKKKDKRKRQENDDDDDDDDHDNDAGGRRGRAEPSEAEFQAAKERIKQRREGK